MSSCKFTETKCFWKEHFSLNSSSPSCVSIPPPPPLPLIHLSAYFPTTHTTITLNVSKKSQVVMMTRTRHTCRISGWNENRKPWGVHFHTRLHSQCRGTHTCQVSLNHAHTHTHTNHCSCSACQDLSQGVCGVFIRLYWSCTGTQTAVGVTLNPDPSPEHPAFHSSPGK